MHSAKYLFAKASLASLQMEINPKLLVAELDFDNNIAVCDLQYTGYAAFFSNCHYESLL